MSIELLYIIPIIALVVFTFVVSLLSQKRGVAVEGNKSMAVQVQQFNDGKFIPADGSAHVKLDEFEQTISSFNDTLSNQQKVIEKFNRENNTYNIEIDRLKNQLRELHKEYDIVVSENFSLRAKYDSLLKRFGAESELTLQPPHMLNFSESEPRRAAPLLTTETKSDREFTVNIFDETRIFTSSNLDDTKEYDISDLMK